MGQGRRLSVVPAGRHYLLQLRVEAPTAVSVDGHGELPRRTGPGGAGWWVDDAGFTRVRLPDRPAGTVTVRATT